MFKSFVSLESNSSSSFQREVKKCRGLVGVVSVVECLPSMCRALKWVWRHGEEGHTKEGKFGG